MLILGIESSCDDTAAAVIRGNDNGQPELLADLVDSQVHLHSRYGGVVPELASRKHLEHLQPLVTGVLAEAGVELAQLAGIAVTQGPGLVGSLLVGLSFAKALAYVRKLPLVGVDHIAAHLLSCFLEADQPAFPYLSLVVSGGHSSLFLVQSPHRFHLLGRTRDDAAGEAFDKVAKLLGLPYPGGPVISRLAEEGDPAAIPFPRAWLEPDSLDFSFSGLKTAVALHVRQLGQPALKPTVVADICASFQEAVVEVLATKALRAARAQGVNRLTLAGGVAANRRLRRYLRHEGAKAGVEVFAPSPRFCTDNGAMVALTGLLQWREARRDFLDLDVYSRSLHVRAPGHRDKHSYGPARLADSRP